MMLSSLEFLPLLENAAILRQILNWGRESSRQVQHRRILRLLTTFSALKKPAESATYKKIWLIKEWEHMYSYVACIDSHTNIHTYAHIYIRAYQSCYVMALRSTQTLT
jgi:hypothetical protein